MKLPEKEYARLPAHLKMLFERLPNPGSEEVLRGFPEGSASGHWADKAPGFEARDYNGRGADALDAGSAARFFYTAKADADDRLGSKHPTVKPVDLMAYLVRLVTPPGGLVLDPFAGSGTTGMACMREGFHAILIEREAEYVADIKRRLAHVKGEDTPLFSSAPDQATQPIDLEDLLRSK